MFRNFAFIFVIDFMMTASYMNDFLVFAMLHVFMNVIFTFFTN